MKMSRIIYLFILLMLSSCVLLLRVHIGSYTPFHFLFFCFVLLVCFFPKATYFKELFKADSITICLLLFICVVVLSYVFNMREANLIAETYGANTGEHPSNLYMKMALNGLIYVSVVFFAYRLGKSFCYDEDNLKKICKSIFFLCAVNAAVNVVAWLFITKGVIGRYNFDPPLTFSPGVSIQYSMLGFLMGLPMIAGQKNRLKLRLLYIIEGTLLLSILIILTRQSQLSFVIMCGLYACMTIKLTLKKIFIVIPAVLMVLVFGGIALFAFGAFDSYTTINSTESTDVAIRVLMINSAYDLFLSHPIFGIGYGMFVGHNNIPIVITGVPTYLASPHNGIAAIFCELGSLGIVTYFVLIIVLIKKMNKARKFIHNDNIRKYATSIFVFQLTLTLTFFISNSHLFGPPSEAPYLCMSFICWLLIGALIGIGKRFSSEKL